MATTLLGLFLCSSAFPTTTIAFQGGHRLHAQQSSQQATYYEEVYSSAASTYGIDAPYNEANYDPQAAAEFYKDRPVESLSRLTQIVSKSSGFIVDTILDAKLNREEEVS